MKMLPITYGHNLKWKMPKVGKVCLFKSYYMSILMYGEETWIKADISTLIVAEIRFL
jgi:hypothetical protein